METQRRRKKTLPRPGIIQNSCEFSGFEPGTFRSSVWRSPNWAISAVEIIVEIFIVLYCIRKINMHWACAECCLTMKRTQNKMALPTLQPYWLKNYKNRNEGLMVRRTQYEAERREAWDKNARYFDRSNVETTKQRVWGSRQSYEERWADSYRERNNKLHLRALIPNDPTAIRKFVSKYIVVQRFPRQALVFLFPSRSERWLVNSL